MMTTLVLTRKAPGQSKNNDLFHDSGYNLNGRFGTLVALKGPRLADVTIVPQGTGEPGAISVPTGVLKLTRVAGESGDIREVGRFTTIERMDGVVQLDPRLAKAFPIYYESNNSAVLELAKVEKSTDGRCFHVQIPHQPGEEKADAKRKDYLNRERGILLHRAPHVGWLTGCISPRKWKDRRMETDTSAQAMEQLYKLVGKIGDLFVLDW